MMKLVIATALLATSTLTAAHEVWIERDGDAPARIYLGEPAEPIPPGGDPEFVKLRAPHLVPASSVSLVRKTDHLEAAVPTGDVRAWDGNVFAPWGPAERREAVVYYARAGRAEPGALLPFEIAPASDAANTFVLMRDGRPQAAAEVTLITPARAKRTLRTDGQGRLGVPVTGKGRYLLSAAARDEGKRNHDGQTIHVLHHVTTTTFVAD
jgi:hypothetical protein